MKFFLSFLVIASLGFSAEARAQRVNFDPQTTYKIKTGDAPALGPADALVTVVEFSDFYCGYCRRANHTLRRLQQLYPRELRVIYVHTPLDPEDGTLAAEAALAAEAQGQFWPMHDRIFSGPRGADRPLLERYARDLGLDLARFRQDLDQRNHLGRLRQHVQVGRELGVSSTPIFFINGKPLVGARDLGTFVRVIEEQLELARQTVKAGIPRDHLHQAIMDSGKERGTTEPVASREPAVIEAGKRYPVGLGLPSHRQGPDDAPVTLVEFSDFECPFCSRAAPTVRKLRETYGDKLRIVYRHLPVPGHVHALLAAEAAVEAGKQGKFWSFHDQLLANHRDLSRSALTTYAERAGLDMARFRAALNTREHMRLVLADFAGGAALGIRGTPTFFVNGVAIIGAKPFEDFKVAIDAELEYADKLVKGGVDPKELYQRVVSGELGTAKLEAGPIALTEVDYHLAVLLACRQKDGARASMFYKEIKDKARRRMLRKDCKQLGVPLK